MANGIPYVPSTSVGTVRRLIGDRTYPYHFSDAEITEFISEANSCKYGAAGLALLAWVAELVREYASVSVGNVSRSTHNITVMQEAAERYIRMSDEVTLDATQDAAFGVARADYNAPISTRREKLRIFAEDSEG